MLDHTRTKRLRRTAPGALALVAATMSAAFVAPAHAAVPVGSIVRASEEGTLSACTQAPPNLPTGQWPAACWRPYAPSSPFNQAVPADPRTLPNSDQIIARIKGDISASDNVGHLAATTSGEDGEPTYYSGASDPLFTLDCTSFGGACSIDGMTIRIPAGAVPEGGPGASPTADRHMTIVDQATGWEYDLWQVTSPTPLPASGGTVQFSWGGRARIDGDGTADEPNGQVGHGTASHFADLAGRVRAEELAAGRIDHALSIVVNCDSGSFVWPARSSDQSCAKVGLSDVDAPPMGAHLQLAMTPAEIDALPIRAWKKVFLRAMAEYGMFISDTGSKNLFGIETEAGNQYLSQGAGSPWWDYGQQNWEPYDPDGAGPVPTSYVAKLYNRPDDPDPSFDWMTNVWSHLRVLDPCVASATC
jgi:hypothetical protein